MHVPVRHVLAIPFLVTPPSPPYSPVLDPLPRYTVYTSGDGVYVVPEPLPSTHAHTHGEGLGAGTCAHHAEVAASSVGQEVVIIGGGPATVTALQTLRSEGFAGKITVLSKEEVLPYDRTKLSKNLAVAVGDVGALVRVGGEGLVGVVAWVRLALG